MSRAGWALCVVMVIHCHFIDLSSFFDFLFLQDIVMFPCSPREGTSSPPLACLSTSCSWTPSRPGATEPTACLVLTQGPPQPGPYPGANTAWSLPRGQHSLVLNAKPSHVPYISHSNPVASFGSFLLFLYLLNGNCIILLNNSNTYEIENKYSLIAF